MSRVIENRVRSEKSDIFPDSVILQSIVETPEAIINYPLEDFDFPHSTDQIRLAVAMVSKSMRDVRGHESKETEKGVLNFHFFKDTVCLGLDGNKNSNPEFWFPINKNAFIPNGTQTASFKERNNLKAVEQVGTANIITSIQKLQSMQSSENVAALTSQLRRLWLGFRWMSANLLIWKNTNQIIMPEDLGESNVPRIDIGSEKVNAVGLFCGPETAAKLKIK